MRGISIFCENVSEGPARDAVQRFETENTDVICSIEHGTSSSGIKKYLGGKNYDVMILSGTENIAAELIPELTDGYFIWGRSENTDIGGSSPVFYTITIPKNALNPADAEKFAKVFLSNRFARYGFTPMQKSAGSWTVRPENMWDGAARYYSLMTLMEVDGTNLQLDCIPLDREDIVLDCGCGPGRVAIQAAKRVKSVICLDSSEGMLEECRKNCAASGVTNVEFILADWQDPSTLSGLPEVDVIIQARGGGGPSTMEQVRKTARKYGVNIMWTPGAPNLPTSKNKLFAGCYSEEALNLHPELRPMEMRGRFPENRKNDGKLFGGLGPVEMENKLPMFTPALEAKLKELNVEFKTVSVSEGWNKDFVSKQEAYTWLIRLSSYPELVNPERFHANVDSFLTEIPGGLRFFLPTSSDVTVYKTR